MNNKTRKIAQILIPSSLGFLMLYLLYKDVNFDEINDLLSTGITYEWLLLSTLIGIAAQIVRAYFWKMLLKPNAIELPNKYIVQTIFVNNGANLILPRAGDFVRTGLVAKRTKVSYSKILGTLITEYIVNTLVIFISIIPAVIIGGGFFLKVYNDNPTSFKFMLDLLHNATFIAISSGSIIAFVLLFIILHKHPLIVKLIGSLTNLWHGIRSIRDLEHPFRFVGVGFLVWILYFLQLYCCFEAFDFTEDITLSGIYIAFVMGSLAGIIPIQGGIGPWHFAIITSLTFYGYSTNDSAAFALIVHTLQTLTFAAMGIWAFFKVGARQTKAQSKAQI